MLAACLLALAAPPAPMGGRDNRLPAQDAGQNQPADAADQERLKYPDILYFTTDREPLRGRVIEEADTHVLFEAVDVSAKAKGLVRVRRAIVEKIEYFEDYCLDQANAAVAAKRYDDAKVWLTRAGNHLSAMPAEDPRRGTLQAVQTGFTQIDFQRGEDLRAAGRAEEALAVFEEIYKSRKDWPGLQKAVSNILCEMAQGLQGKQKFEESGAVIRRLLALYPDDAGGRVYEAALQKHYDAIRKKAEGLVAQARASMKKKQYKEAIAVLLEAVQTDPNIPHARELLTECRTKYQVLRYGDFEFPASLHPLVAFKLAEKRVAQLLFDGLVDRRDRLESDVYFPRLAVKHATSEDNLVHTFTLAAGLRWSDGQPLTSADVAFTVRALKNEQGDGYNKSWASWIQSVETPDPATVRIIFTRPACRPVALLAFKVVPRHKFGDEAPRRRSDFSLAPVGAGPFALAKFTGEEEVVLKPNEHFRLRSQGQPRLSEVALKRYYDRVTAFTDFVRGDLELLTQLEPLQKVQLDKLGESKFSVKSHETRTVYFLAMNFRRKIFQDFDMRRAVLAAIDRHSIIVQHFRGEREGGQGHRLVTGPFPTGTWAYNDGKNPNIPMPDYLMPKKDAESGDPGHNPELAKSLVQGLKNRGLGVLLDITLKFPSDDLKVERACVEMRNQLNDAGIRVRAEKRMENNLHDEIYGSGDFDLVYTSYSLDDTMDVSPLFDFEQIGSYRPNFAAYKNPDLNVLFTEIKKTPDPQRIKDLSWEIHATVARDLAIIPLWQLDNYVAFKAAVQNVKVHPYYLFGAPEEWSIAEE